ncbi:MAG: hypothetical protein K9L79_11780 [Methylobacter tundripaludum]|nr:hypothetical protein [Methylobacter tundripaludum]
MLRVSTAALLAFLIFLVMHFAYFHYCMPIEKVKSLLLTAGLGLIFFSFFIYIFPSEEWFKGKLHISDGVMSRWVYPAFGVLFYGFLLLGYLEFYFTADRSITFRMLMITDKQINHSVTKEQMVALYDVPGILDKRFEDLTYGGYFELNGDVYRLTDKGKIILRIYKVAIEELHLGTGEQARKYESNLTDSK